MNIFLYLLVGRRKASLQSLEPGRKAISSNSRKASQSFSLEGKKGKVTIGDALLLGGAYYLSIYYPYYWVGRKE
jgi:hypothetical protein